jgi:hypothetical protein
MNYSNNLQRINDSTIYVVTSSNLFKCTIKNDKLKHSERLLTFNPVPTHQLNCFIYTRNKILWVGSALGTIYKIGPDAHFQTIQIPENYLVRSFSEDIYKRKCVGGFC